MRHIVATKTKTQRNDGYPNKRVRLRPGENVPEGVQVYTNKSGSRYYMHNKQTEIAYLNSPKIQRIWQLPLKDFLNSEMGIKYKDALGRETIYSGKDYEVRNSTYFHDALVRRALIAGLNVPDEVLKDYPDLQNDKGR